MEFLLHLYVVTSIIVAGCSGRESYTIIRRDNGDIFQIPSRMCSDSGKECQIVFHKKAFSTGSGKCKCGCPYRSATFGWYKRKWTCIDNSEVRKQSGCTHGFKSEQKISPLKVMKEGEAYSVKLSSSSCEINFSSSRYLNCDGTWDRLGLNQNSGNDFIEFKSKKSKRKTRDGSDFTYKLKIINDIKGSLAGQVVKLQIQCNGLQTSCLLFKIFGEITCPVDPRQQLVSSPFPSSKPSSPASSSSSSSGTMAAVVIVVILIIIIAAFVVFVIWKRKRGEDVWIVDRLTRFARRGQSSLKTDKQEEPAHEQIYAEISEQPTQAGTKTSILLSGGTVELEESPPTDDDGYAEPPYALSYHVLEDPNEQRMDDIARAEKLNSDSQGQ